MLSCNTKSYHNLASPPKFCTKFWGRAKFRGAVNSGEQAVDKTKLEHPQRTNAHLEDSLSLALSRARLAGKEIFLSGKKGGRGRRRRGREERRRERREREEKRRERRFNHKLKSHDKYGYRYNLEEQCVKVC